MQRPDPQTLAPSAGTRRPRDPRIDAFRGLALVTIFVDHVPGNPYEQVTLRNWGFSDAAEAFFIMSGIAAGLAYSGALASGPFWAGAKPVWRRAWLLYLVHLCLSLWAIAIFAAGADVFGLPALLEKNNLGAVFQKTGEALVGLPLLLHQLGYVNILPVYSVLLLCTPFAIRVGRTNPWWLAGGAVALWFAAGLWRLNFPNYPNPGGWFFNPFSWQLVFVLGLLTGVRMRQGARFVPKRPVLLWIAGMWLLLVLAWRLSPDLAALLNHQMARLGALGAPFHLISHDKTFLALPRLLHALALVYVLSCSATVRRAAGHVAAAPLRLLGRHGLLVFSVGTLLSLLMQVALAALPAPDAAAWGLIPLGILAMLAVAWIAEARRQTSAPRMVAGAPLTALAPRHPDS
ncbi:OpgC domain-containing protein [Salipiger sp. P9]|uniref:OpgC family protein n=1 Tax=Salipiger pentaromativorans TaxID=2943193 RepID=UPI002158051F|nr:OpgC domain-containing protein [Salipiger pentaromativorans]MCR8550998.1 OpgC domain-containing protein [Salipiger pentaromativorans]